MQLTYILEDAQHRAFKQVKRTYIRTWRWRVFTWR